MILVHAAPARNTRNAADADHNWNNLISDSHTDAKPGVIFFVLQSVFPQSSSNRIKITLSGDGLASCLRVGEAGFFVFWPFTRDPAAQAVHLPGPAAERRQRPAPGNFLQKKFDDLKMVTLDFFCIR